MTTKAKKTNDAATPAPSDAEPVPGLNQEELSQLLAGAVAHHARQQLLAGDGVDLDELVPAEAVSRMTMTGRGILAGVRTMVAAGQAPNEMALRQTLSKIGLHQAISSITRVWRDTADLADRVADLAEQLADLPLADSGVCVVEVINKDEKRSRTRGGEVYPPGLKIRTAIRDRGHWLQVKATKSLEVKVVEGEPPTASIRRRDS